MSLVMADQPEGARPQPQIALARAKDFRTAFTNTFRLRLGNNDCSLIFGFQTELANQQALLNEEVELVMTPITLKHLSEVLKVGIQQLETALGAPVVLPDHLVKNLDEGFVVKGTPPSTSGEKSDKKK